MSFGRAVTPLWRGPSLCPCWPGSESLGLWGDTFCPYFIGGPGGEGKKQFPRSSEPPPRIVRGIPDPEYLQHLERAGIDYELGGQVTFEESSEWRCRSCGHEWREDESSILG